MPIAPTRTKIIACNTVIEEILPLMPPGMDYQLLDFGLHVRPDSLRSALQAAIDPVTAPIDTILLGFGLCSQAVVGLRSGPCRLVVPRVADCIGIFLGSDAAYNALHFSDPGTYYLTKGWIEASEAPFADWGPMVERYGEEKAHRLIAMMLKNYTRMALINTGQYEMERYRDYTRRLAASYGLRYEEIPGSNAMVKRLLYGPWDGEFVVTEPGETITFEHFRNTVGPT